MLTFDAFFWIGLAAAATGVVVVSRSAWPASARIGVMTGLAMVALALASPSTRIERPPRVVVMLDLSPSTRGRDFLDPKQLAARCRQLLGEIPVVVLPFGGEGGSSVAAKRPSLDEVTALDEFEESPADRTVYEPDVSADAVLLFSDGQFSLPAGAPPTFCVIDSAGDTDRQDTAAESLSVNEGVARLGVLNNSSLNSAIPVMIAVDASVATFDAARGRSVVSRPIPSGVVEVVGGSWQGDRWPENNFLSAAVQHDRTEQIWVGAGAPAGWRPRDLKDVAISAGRLLSAGVVAIGPTDGATVDDRVAHGLAAYARDLGGTLILTGGRGGLAGGGWGGTDIDAASPLAMHPPTPQRFWVILVDSSGSMAAREPGGLSRFERAEAAARAVLGSLPARDQVMFGSFAETVRWWTAAPIELEKLGNLPRPANVEPRGPTNLTAAVSALAAVGASLPVEVIVITDGDVPADSLAEVADALIRKRIRLNVVLTGDEKLAGGVIDMANATGGRVVVGGAPADWSAVARRLGVQLGSAETELGPFRIEIEGMSVEVSERSAGWLREGARVIGTAGHSGENPLPGDRESEPEVMAAEWHYGAGRVVALRFAPDAALLDALAHQYALPPRDPRFAIRQTHGEQTIVRIEAAEDGKPLNGQQFTARSIPGTGDNIGSRPFEQVAPGRYELSLKRSTNQPVLAISLDGKVIDRVAVESRYAVEFDRIGINREKLVDLADRTGGAVIEPQDTTPLKLPKAWRRIDLTPWCASLAAVLILGALVAARQARRSVM